MRFFGVLRALGAVGRRAVRFIIAQKRTKREREFAKKIRAILPSADDK